MIIYLYSWCMCCVWENILKKVRFDVSGRKFSSASSVFLFSTWVRSNKVTKLLGRWLLIRFLFFCFCFSNQDSGWCIEINGDNYCRALVGDLSSAGDLDSARLSGSPDRHQFTSFSTSNNSSIFHSSSPISISISISSISISPRPPSIPIPP